ncbi:MAG: LemA family protein [Planctomycetes bacterium]|nr:LemA family protein [Planctomycetota bacterium]
MLAALDQDAVAVIVAASGALAGWAFATALRRRDHRTFVLGRAPALSVRTLSAHDDAWLRGAVRCVTPLVCPWFDVDCVAYSYEIEEERTETHTDAEGKTRTTTTWETVHSESRAIPFVLDDGARITVDLPDAENEALRSLGTEHERSDRRHSAKALQLGADVSVLGVLRDDGSFGPFRGVPLLVTPKTRDQRIRSSQRSEGWFQFWSLLFPYAGLVVATALWRRAQHAADWLVPAAVGAAVLVPQWWLLTFNRLVRLRQQVHAAQKQVSIELQQRRDLVPNLVAVVEAASTHERELLERLTALRAAGSLPQQVRAEEASRGAAREALLLHERYPQLRSDALYRDLHDRLCTIEEKVAHARSFYNDTVTEWNDRVQQVPSTLVAIAAGMRPQPLFATGLDERLPKRLDER